MKKHFFSGLSLLSIFFPLVVFASGNDTGLLIPCAATGDCDNINDLVLQAIVIAEFLIGIAGSIALVMFVYGGLQYITSFGSAEKKKKGQGVLVGAVVGLIITFSAFLLIQFVMNALGVSSYFS